MPRDLGNKNNKAIIKDGISGSEIELTYRTPRSSELQGYYSQSIKRHGGKTISNAVAARVAFAGVILTGIRDGDFAINDKPLSSNPESPDHDAEWKNKVAECAPDILDTFILSVFDQSRMSQMNESEAEDKDPLA